MALMQTDPCNFTFKATEFNLMNVDGKTYSLTDIKRDKGILIMFICNHCPYVKAIIHDLVEDAKKIQNLGVGVAAIMPNDTVNYPEDSFENMIEFSKKNDFSFPYLLDENQEIAKSYDAICTPDFFGFNDQLELHYRGRLNENNPSKQNPKAVPELYNAMKQIAETGKGPDEQFPSMGCSIKWK